MHLRHLFERRPRNQVAPIGKSRIPQVGRAIAAAALAIGVAAPAARAQILFTDRAAFQAALSSFSVYYAATDPLNPPAFQSIDAVGSLTVLASSDMWVIPFNPGDLAHAYGPGPRAAVYGVEPDAQLNDIPQTRLGSAVPLYAFGIDYGIPELPDVFGLSTFTFSFNNGLSYQRIGNPTGAPGDRNKQLEFFGLISPTSFTEIRYRVDNAECSGFCAWNAASWDGITIAAAVPEPGTFVLVGGGVALVAAAARRRRHR